MEVIHSPFDGSAASRTMAMECGGNFSFELQMCPDETCSCERFEGNGSPQFNCLEGDESHLRGR